MTRGEIKAKLQSYGSIDRERRQIEGRILRLEATLGPSSPGSNGMPHGSGISDPTGNKAAALLELQQLYEDLTCKLARECLRIEALIEGLEPTERRLARYRYIEGLSWEEVCVEMGYSWRQVHRIHSRILDKLAALENMA